MIPLSSSETTTYFPPSLSNLEPRPTFLFRPPSPRSKRQYSRALLEEGLRFHVQESVEAETLTAMRELWAGDDDQLLANESRLTAFWETVRQARKDPTIVIDQAEADAVMAAVTRLVDAWPKLRAMNADNIQFNNDAPKIALGMFLARWSNVDAPFRLEDGRVPLDCLDVLEDKIDEIEKAAQADNVEGVIGVAFTELSLHALSLMSLTESAEKNSPSPSSPSDTPAGSTTAGDNTSDESESSSSPGATRRPRTKSPANS